jgi:hypothetical protein
MNLNGSNLKSNALTDKKFKIGDFVTYNAFDELGLPAGINWGEIIDIDEDVASIVLGGIVLNRDNHFRPNYMEPIRIRPRKDSDVVIKRKISSLSFANDTNWNKKSH